MIPEKQFWSRDCYEPEKSEDISAVRKLKIREYKTTLLALGGILIIITGAISLRAEIVLLGCVPFSILVYTLLKEKVLFSTMKRDSLKAYIYPVKNTIRVNKEIDFGIVLENPMPYVLDNVIVELKTGPGIKPIPPFKLTIWDRAREELKIKLVPLRAGQLFFHGFSVVIYPAFNLRPKRFYFVMPFVLNCEAEISKINFKAATRKSEPSRYPLPSRGGDFAYLRDYVTGDPWKSISTSASLRKRKPVVVLSYPQKISRQAVLIDVSESLFRGRPGKAPFDQIAFVLPSLLKELKIKEIQTELIAFDEEIRVHYKNPQVNSIVEKLSIYRYLASEKGLNYPDILLERLNSHLRWNYGSFKSLPEFHTGKRSSLLLKKLDRLNQKLDYPPGLKKINQYHRGIVENKILKLCYKTGMELPNTNSHHSGLGKSLDLVLSRNIKNITIFSDFDPYPRKSGLLKRLHLARQKNIALNFMIFDRCLDLLKPYGLDLLKAQYENIWEESVNLFKYENVYITFWNPFVSVAL
ncbi:MAG: hypothetical protein PF689_08820 [Deltaproteobacteria bacterium]|jgi:uncharacterized protein (DUF58 family)|nr:hypothetical protein [Deltaproteobacteria bacterium]